MFLAIGIMVAVLFALAKPYGHGYINTAAWVAKVSMPKGTELSNEVMEEMLTLENTLQTNRLFLFQNIIYVILIVGIVLGCFPNWWGGLIVLATAIGCTYLTDLFLTPSLSYYLKAMQKRMAHSIVLVKKENNQKLLVKYEGYLKILDNVIPIYAQSKLLPPNGFIRGENPYGNATYLLDNYFVK